MVGEQRVATFSIFVSRLYINLHSCVDFCQQATKCLKIMLVKSLRKIYSTSCFVALLKFFIHLVLLAELSADSPRKLNLLHISLRSRLGETISSFFQCSFWHFLVCLSQKKQRKANILDLLADSSMFTPLLLICDESFVCSTTWNCYGSTWKCSYKNTPFRQRAEWIPLCGRACAIFVSPCQKVDMFQTQQLCHS